MTDLELYDRLIAKVRSIKMAISNLIAERDDLLRVLEYLEEKVGDSNDSLSGS